MLLYSHSVYPIHTLKSLRSVGKTANKRIEFQKQKRLLLNATENLLFLHTVISLIYISVKCWQSININVSAD